MTVKQGAFSVTGLGMKIQVTHSYSLSGHTQLADGIKAR